MSLICGGVLAFDILDSRKTVLTLSTVVAMIANGSADNWNNVSSANLMIANILVMYEKRSKYSNRAVEGRTFDIHNVVRAFQPCHVKGTAWISESRNLFLVVDFAFPTG
jgi:hypothetical protein